MANKQAIQQKFKQLGVNRDVSAQDMANVDKYGIGILDRTFGGNQGISTKQGQQQPETAAQVGQGGASKPIVPTYTPPAAPTALATLDQLKSQESSLIAKQAEVGSQQYTVQEVLGKLLEAKKNAAPFDKKIAKVQQRLGKSTLTGYINEGLSLDQSIQFMSQDIADANSQIGFYQAKKDEASTSVAEAVQSTADYLNAQLASIGLQVQSVQQQKGSLIQEQQFQQSFAEQQRQFNAQLARSGAQGSGRNTSIIDVDGKQVLIDTDTGETIKELGAAGAQQAYLPGQVVDINGAPVKNVQLQSTVTGFDDSLTILDQINELKPDVNTGFISGRVNSLLGKFDQADPKALELSTKTANLKSAFMNALSGAAVSPAEQQRLEKFLPSANDSDTEFMTKIQSMYDIIDQQKNNLLNQYGAIQIPKNTVIENQSATSNSQGIDLSDLNFNLSQ